jgi:hypothetical protein
VAKGRYKEALVVSTRVMIYGVCAPRPRPARDPSLLHVRVAVSAPTCAGRLNLQPSCQTLNNKH